MIAKIGLAILVVADDGYLEKSAVGRCLLVMTISWTSSLVKGGPEGEDDDDADAVKGSRRE